jgi:WD40 repeat protein
MAHADLTHPPRSTNPTLPRGERAALAQVAFGSVDRRDSTAIPTTGVDEGRHLAFVSGDVLALDLSVPAQRHFGDYELIELIGEGGMGVVYRARQVSLDREVAMKLLSAGPWASTDFIERFRQEAQNAARMQHPNIVAIHEVGETEGLHFFSMRLVRGTSLAQVIRSESRLPPLRAAALLRTIAEAVDYAHRLGVLHLDLKPGNVLVDEAGEPHVADFGLARRIEQGAAAGNVEISGTPSYMAPEQATAGRITAATDIWGLGAIAYEMLTGKPPFLGESPESTLHLVVRGDLTPPRQIVPGLSRDLEAIVLKCMARDVADRYGSARELADDLARFIDGRPVSVRPLNALQRVGRWARREPRLAGSLALALLALIVGLVATTTQWRRADANANAARHTAWSQRIDGVWQGYESGDWFGTLPRLVANLREEEAVGARVEAEAERRRLGILFANSPRLIDVLALGGSIASVAISADGKRVAVFSRRPDPSGKTNDGTLHLIDAETGEITWHVDVDRSVDWPEFSADGRTLFLDANQAQFAGYDEGAMRRFAIRDGAELEFPFAIPGPRVVIYARSSTAALIVDKDGTMQMRRTDEPHAPSAWQRRFEANGRLALSDDGSTVVYVAPGDPKRIELIDAATGKVLRSLVLQAGERIQLLRLAPDGGSVAISIGQGRLVFATLGAPERVLGQPCDFTFAPIAYSSDSSLLATTCGQTTFIWHASDLTPVMAIDHQQHPWVVAVDPERRTLFTYESGNPRVYQLPPDLDRVGDSTTGTPLLVSRIEHEYWAGAFDAAHGLLAVGTRTGQLKLWRVPASARLPVTGAPIAPSDLSFDGERMVAVRVSEAFAVDAGDGHPLGPALAHAEPVWLAETLPDEGVLTASGRELRVWNGRSGTLRFAPLVLPNTPWRVIPSPDGNAVLTSMADYENGRCKEHLQMWRTSDGTLVAEADVPGPLEGVRFALDGSQLIGWRGNEVWLRDGRTLSGPSLTLQHKDLAGPVEVVEARLVGDELQAATRRRSINYAAYYWRWDARSGALREQLPLAGMAHRFVSTPAGKFASYGYQGVAPLLVERRALDGALEWLPGPRNPLTASGLAYDRAGSILAQAPDNGALLVDAAAGAALSPLLGVAMQGNDRPTQLAFDPASTRLSGRSAYGRLLRWDIAPDKRALPELERDAELYAAARNDARWSVLGEDLPPATRAALRARDPGPPRQAVEETPFDPNTTVLPRATDNDAALLDLGPYYTPVEDRQNTENLFDLRSVPIGRQRFLGVDFDIRGMIQLAADHLRQTSQNFPSRVDGIALPAHVDALDLLVEGYAIDDAVHPLLDVVFHYHDGGERRVELTLRGVSPPFHADSDPLGEPESWRGARIAWLGSRRQGATAVTQAVPICLMRVPNPEPGREVSTLSLEARGSPYILAITVEAPSGGKD